MTLQDLDEIDKNKCDDGDNGKFRTVKRTFLEISEVWWKSYFQNREIVSDSSEIN